MTRVALRSSPASRAALGGLFREKFYRQLQVTCGFLLAGGMVGCGSAPGPAAGPTPDPATAPPVSKGAYSTPFMMAGIDRPPTRPAAEAKLPDETEVIGVTAGGKARAYVVSVFIGPTRHIVNDLLGDVPVSITYCDLCDAVRVFTGDVRGTSLRINQGGRVQGRMVLHFDGNFYFQDTSEPIASNSPRFPYSNHPFKRCTWKEWRSAHPDSDVYVGVIANP